MEDKARKILSELELFRMRRGKLPEIQSPVDWTIRVCEAIVADVYGYNSRADWYEFISDCAKFETY